MNEGPDYINANKVDLEIYTTGQINRYIAAQGPMQHTCKDFWQVSAIGLIMIVLVPQFFLLLTEMILFRGTTIYLILYVYKFGIVIML